MGYDICTTPGPRWFGCQPYMLEARKLQLALSKPPEAVRSIAELYGLRLLIARAIVLMAGNVPGGGNSFALLRQAAEAPFIRQLDCHQLLHDLTAATFEVGYGGSGQYGVPNYDFQCGETIERGTDGMGPLFLRAYAERLEFAKALWNVAQDILFEVYWEERKRDLTYYGFWEGVEEAKVLAAVVYHGLFKDEAAAAAACNGSIQALRGLPQVRELEGRLHKQSWQDFHRDNWSDFREADAIWHGHCD